MGVIPLDVQRRFERRWAARFVRQAPEPSSEKSEHERHGQRLGGHAKAKRKTRQPKPAGRVKRKRGYGKLAI
jgi:hypothetical protein